MPICPKCGKHLTSEQALTYHLNRKYKCGTWKCATCNKVCTTKLDLQMHEIHCNDTLEVSTTMLRKIYDNVPGILITSGETILNMSPNTKELFGLEEACPMSVNQLSGDFRIRPVDWSLCFLSKF